MAFIEMDFIQHGPTPETGYKLVLFTTNYKTANGIDNYGIADGGDGYRDNEYFESYSTSSSTGVKALKDFTATAYYLSRYAESSTTAGNHYGILKLIRDGSTITLISNQTLSGEVKVISTTFDIKTGDILYGTQRANGIASFRSLVVTAKL